MHAISNYQQFRVIMVTDPQTNLQTHKQMRTHRQDRLQYTMLLSLVQEGGLWRGDVLYLHGTCNNNNNNSQIYIAPYGRNFRGAGSRSDSSVKFLSE